MTALNIWHDGASAFILNDTATTSPEGVVTSLGCKTIIASGALALAVTGIGFGAAVVRSWLASTAFSHPAEAVSALPAMLRECEHEVRRQHGPIRWTAGIAAAAFCPDERRPLLFVCGNDEEWLGDGYEPFKLSQVGYWTTGAEPFGPFTFDRPRADVSGFWPGIDGLAMMEAQRRAPYADGTFRIGGAAMLTEVSAEGVAITQLRAWPDMVGEPIAV